MKAIKKKNRNNFTGRVLQTSVTYAFSNPLYFKTLLLTSNFNTALLLWWQTKDKYFLKHLSKATKKYPDFSYNKSFQYRIRA